MTVQVVVDGGAVADKRQAKGEQMQEANRAQMEAKSQRKARLVWNKKARLVGRNVKRMSALGVEGRVAVLMGRKIATVPVAKKGATGVTLMLEIGIETVEGRSTMAKRGMATIVSPGVAIMEGRGMAKVTIIRGERMATIAPSIMTGQGRETRAPQDTALMPQKLVAMAVRRNVGRGLPERMAVGQDAGCNQCEETARVRAVVPIGGTGALCVARAAVEAGGTGPCGDGLHAGGFPMRSSGSALWTVTR